MKLKEFTIEDIRSWQPCYDPIKYLREGWKGNALDILKHKDIPIKDKFWVVFRDEVISDKVLRLFAVWSYRETLKFISNPDPRSLKAAEVAEAYALGKATKEELEQAKAAARSAARSAARLAAEAAIWSAWSAELTARSAARSAAESAWSAESAARLSAESAAEAAIWSAWSAELTARSAARSAEAAETNQLNKLIELLEQGE